MSPALLSSPPIPLTGDVEINAFIVGLALGCLVGQVAILVALEVARRWRGAP